MSYDYNPGAVTVNSGSQQVTIYPYQDITSVHANEILEGIIEPGVYASFLEVFRDAMNTTFRVKAESSFVFRKTYNSASFIAKSFLKTDADIVVATADLYSGFFSPIAPAFCKGIIIVATWSYDLTNPTYKFVAFKIVPYSDDNILEIKNNNDLIVGVFLNHENSLASVNNYKISYQDQENREVLKHLYNEANQSLIRFSSEGTNLIVSPRTFILSDTVINFPTETIISSFPSQVVGAYDNTYSQIDVLRIKTEHTDGTNIPYFEWESFIIHAVRTTETIPEFINGFEFTWYDPGYNILFVVRRWDTIPLNPQIWPNDCWEPLRNMPQLSTAEYLTRFRLPIY